MRLAIISDIHGNIEALEEVFIRIDELSVDDIWVAGDLVGYLPYPNEVIDTLRSRGLKMVMGNYDDAVAFSRIECGCNYPDEKAMELGVRSLEWTKEVVRDDNKEFLKTLPMEVSMQVGDNTILMVHGSPRALNEYLNLDVPEENIKIMIEDRCHVLICGHTHIPYHRQIGDMHIINSGSVGKPKDGDPRATFGIVEFSRNGDITVDFIRVPYNMEKVARAIVEAGLPKEFTQEILHGRVI